MEVSCKCYILCLWTLKRLIIGIECLLYHFCLYISKPTLQSRKKKKNKHWRLCSSTRAGKQALRELDAQLEHVWLTPRAERTLAALFISTMQRKEIIRPRKMNKMLTDCVFFFFFFSKISRRNSQIMVLRRATCFLRSKVPVAPSISGKPQVERPH